MEVNRELLSFISILIIIGCVIYLFILHVVMKRKLIAAENQMIEESTRLNNVDAKLSNLDAKVADVSSLNLLRQELNARIDEQMEKVKQSLAGNRA